MSAPSLAIDVEGLRVRNANLISREGWAKGLAFEPRTSDVFIATYPKCGTTLLQQIVHGLRTGGDLDFAEITEVIPWIELAHDMGLDPLAEQRADPRAYKTHLSWHDVPKGGRYLYAIRDPLSVLVSFYHFLEGWFFEPGKIDLETFALDYLLTGSRSGRYWEHLVSWWPQRDAGHSCFVCYEDLVADLPGWVARIASFLGLEERALEHESAEAERLASTRIEIATHQAKIEFMAAHPTLWDDNLLRAARNEACGLPADAGSTKVRPPDAPPRAQITEDIEKAWQQEWKEVVAPATGLESYADLRRCLARDGAL